MNAPSDIPAIPQERAVALTAWFSVLMHSARTGRVRDAREAQEQVGGPRRGRAFPPR